LNALLFSAAEGDTAMSTGPPEATTMDEITDSSLFSAAAENETAMQTRPPEADKIAASMFSAVEPESTTQHLQQRSSEVTEDTANPIEVETEVDTSMMEPTITHESGSVQLYLMIVLIPVTVLLFLAIGVACMLFRSYFSVSK
jgi:hypothetical protein